MKFTQSLCALCLLSLSTAVYAADPLCEELNKFVADQKAEIAEPVPRHWVEFHWGIDPDPDVFWSWGCRHSGDLSSEKFCDWLMKNTSKEFPNMLPISVQTCMGFRFPGNTRHEWHMTDGRIEHQLKAGDWLILELAAHGLQPGESAIRISYNTVDRILEPDELLPIRELREGKEYRAP